MDNAQSIAVGRRSSLLQLVPVMLCFFAMGFVDLVGTASNYVQKDLGLTDSQANLFPSLVFFWFLIFSVPTGMLMNRIGRKRTVLLSLAVTAVSLIIPLTGDGYVTMLLAFSLLGIGNAIMQTSLNPLVTNLIGGDRLASTLTFGQFVKAIASFLAPIICAWGATTYLPVFGLGWRVLFVIYAAVSILSVAVLGATPIAEERPDRASGVKECLKLLGRRSYCSASLASCVTWASMSVPTPPRPRYSWSASACRSRRLDSPPASTSYSAPPAASSERLPCASYHPASSSA